MPKRKSQFLEPTSSAGNVLLQSLAIRTFPILPAQSATPLCHVPLRTLFVALPPGRRHHLASSSAPHTSSSRLHRQPHNNLAAPDGSRVRHATYQTHGNHASVNGRDRLIRLDTQTHNQVSGQGAPINSTHYSGCLQFVSMINDNENVNGQPVILGAYPTLGLLSNQSGQQHPSHKLCRVYPLMRPPN